MGTWAHDGCGSDRRSGGGGGGPGSGAGAAAGSAHRAEVGGAALRRRPGRVRQRADAGGDRAGGQVPRRGGARGPRAPPGDRRPPQPGRPPQAPREHQGPREHRERRGELMGQPFEQHREAEVPASPDEVWAAIATGPGIDSWFMGRSDVQPGAGGTVRTVVGEYAPELAVTAWEPARRLAYGGGKAPDGRFIAYEFLVEGRAGASTVLRTV